MDELKFQGAGDMQGNVEGARAKLGCVRLTQYRGDG